MNAPALRFKNAQGHHFIDWSERTLGQVCKINQGLQIPISERFSDSGENRYFYITNEFLRKDSDKQYFIENPPASVLCNKDDILMTRTGNTGKVVTDVSGAFHNNFFKINYDRGLLNKTFLCEFLSLDKTQSLILKLAGTSTIPDLNHGDFYKIKIYLPALEEQTKIADFLMAVDEKITQLTQKCELLTRYKKGVMQQIFSQELRFKDDDGQDYPNWIDKSLSNLGSSFNGLTGKSGDDFGTGMPYITYKQIFDNSFIDTSKFSLVQVSDNEKQNKVKYGDVFFTTSSETPEEVGFCSVLLSHVNDVYLNSFCFGFRIKSFEALEPNFARYLFKSPSFRRDVIKLAQGSTRYNISKTNFMEIVIQLPCVQEQLKIAKFLTALDDKLTHTQNQLTAVKQYKQGLLQQMFV
jgi:type I restriction enzyme, S subunit